MSWTDRTYPTGYLIPTPRVDARTFDPRGEGQVDRIMLTEVQGGPGTPITGGINHGSAYGAVACPPVGYGDIVMAVDDDGAVFYGSPEPHAGWLSRSDQGMLTVRRAVDEDGHPVDGPVSVDRWFLAWGKPERAEIPADEDAEERALRRKVQDEEAQWKGILFRLMAAAEAEGTQTYITNYLDANDEAQIRETFDSDEPIVAETRYVPVTEALVGRRGGETDARLNGLPVQQWEVASIPGMGATTFADMSTATNWWTIEKMTPYARNLVGYEGSVLSVGRGRAATIRPKIAD